MDITINREAFAEALGFCASIAGGKSSVRPILKYVLLRAGDDGFLDLAAAGMESSISWRLGADVRKAGSVCLPAKLLHGLVSECSEEALTLKASPNSHGCELIAGKDRFSLFGADVADFQGSPTFPDGARTVCSGESFQWAVEHTAFAVAKEAGRYALHGVYFESSGNFLECAATDGRRMAACRAKVEGNGLEIGSIIPVQPLNLVCKLVDCLTSKAEGEDPVVPQVWIRSESIQGLRGVFFSVGPVVLYSVVLEGIFPKYGQIIKNKAESEWIFSSQALLSGLVRAARMTSGDSSAVEMNFLDKQVEISASSADRGRATVHVDCDGPADKSVCRFNPQYLLEVLKIARDPVTVGRKGEMVIISEDGPYFRFVLVGMRNET